MAKKKEKELTYLQVPLPEAGKAYRMVKRSWSGLNYRQTVDTGLLSQETNISTEEAPYLVPSQMPAVSYSFHNAASGGCFREETLAAFQDFRSTFGGYPRLHINHSNNIENIYYET